MNSDLKNNIDIDLLKGYYDGTLSNSYRNALEQTALDDPFLKEAMEGFESNPGSFATFYETNYITHQRFGSGYFVIGGILTLGLITLLGILQPAKESILISQNTTDQDTTRITQEVQYIPEEIDSLEEVSETEIIKATEIVTHKTEIQKTINYPELPGDQAIVINEDEKVDEDYDIQSERYDLKRVEYVPATYLFELFVVDYRRIERDNVLITYTKYEFTGTSAEFESEANEQNAELIEKQVDMPYFGYLTNSMEHFANGDYKKAITNYLIILEQYPEDANALFYGGLCYYNLKKFDKSIEFFDRILNLAINAFKEEAKWYKVKSLLKLKRTAEAKKLLDEIISDGSFYADQAVKLKKTI